jgi:pimeloyl-ACP methyl ester carboxylesterase
MPNRPRWGIAVLTAVLAMGPSAQTESGAVPETAPSDWVTVAPGPGAEIVQFIQKLPQDANPLGVPAAHRRTIGYPPPFTTTRFPSDDSTPLAGLLGVHRDGKPRPGVVLVPGFAQTKDHKYIVELADLLLRNGWHVLAIDLRGHGESRALSPALITGGWKETLDIQGAVRYLRDTSQASSVAVIGFSNGGRSLVKAMANKDGQDIAAGIAVTAPLAATTPLKPPEPGFTPTPFQQFFLDFLGSSSFYEYYARSARSYGVDLRTMEELGRADTEVVRVKTPLLMLYALDDTLLLGRIKQGRHDGGDFSLAYRDTVQNHPFVRTLLVDRGNHAGALYLSDPYWFGLSVLSYLKHWQAREVDYVTAAVPALDVLVEATLNAKIATYRFVVRNHGTTAVRGPVDIHLDLPGGAKLGSCWLGTEGFGRCDREGDRLTWTLPRLSGGKATAGPFVATIDVTDLKPGTFEATAWIDQPAIVRQQVLLEKK